mmetsp:Transcript_2229/g.5012  ORF Transcript_2229/g.5012 Transcript_2229/m.5012 type:complete len:215 (-) Transcript_2229:70-714(-)
MRTGEQCDHCGHSAGRREALRRRDLCATDAACELVACLEEPAVPSTLGGSEFPRLGKPAVCCAKRAETLKEFVARVWLAHVRTLRLAIALSLHLDVCETEALCRRRLIRRGHGRHSGRTKRHKRIGRACEGGGKRTARPKGARTRKRATRAERKGRCGRQRRRELPSRRGQRRGREAAHVLLGGYASLGGRRWRRSAAWRRGTLPDRIVERSID